jgi:hypothetical protein
VRINELFARDPIKGITNQVGAGWYGAIRNPLQDQAQLPFSATFPPSTDAQVGVIFNDSEIQFGMGGKPFLSLFGLTAKTESVDLPGRRNPAVEVG